MPESARPALQDDPDSTASIERALADTALEIQSMWAQLGRIEQSRNPSKLSNLKEYPGGEVPDDLRQPLTLETWTGEAGVLARQLADRIGYQYAGLGNKPMPPILVTIAAEDRPIGEILRELGYLTGERAAIVVHGDKKKLEVIYYD